MDQSTITLKDTIANPGKDVLPLGIIIKKNQGYSVNNL